MMSYTHHGNKLTYKDIGSGEVILLVHGFPVDHRAWDEVGQRLAQTYRVIQPDLPGFGGSTLLQGQPSMEAFAEVLAGLLRHLKIGSATVIGHSMGGYVALALAADHQHLVKRLALVGSQIFADPEEVKQLRATQVAELAQIGIKAVLGMANKLTFGKIGSDRLAIWINQQSPLAAAFALTAMGARADRSDVISKFTKPVLLIHGEQDDLVPLVRVERTLSLNASILLVKMAGVGHSPMMEQPQETERAIKDWIKHN